MDQGLGCTMWDVQGLRDSAAPTMLLPHLQAVQWVQGAAQMHTCWTQV